MMKKISDNLIEWEEGFLSTFENGLNEIFKAITNLLIFILEIVFSLTNLIIMAIEIVIEYLISGYKK